MKTEDSIRRAGRILRLAAAASILLVAGVGRSHEGRLLPRAIAQNDVQAAEAKVRFMLDEARARPGGRALLRFSVSTSAPLEAVSVAINFDESRLRLVDVRRALTPEGFSLDATSEVRIDNRDRTPGDQLDEGFVHIQLRAAEADTALALPGNEPVTLLGLEFAVLENARPGRSDVRFTDIGPIEDVAPGQILVNAVTVAEAADLGPQRLVAEDDFDHGAIYIIGEIGFFMRGDTDLSCVRDLTDPILTFDYLFRGGPEPPCLDAADADDSGVLDLSDGIFTLSWLFRGGPDFSEPFLEPGEDPTPDGLDCAQGYDDSSPCMAAP